MMTVNKMVWLVLSMTIGFFTFMFLNARQRNVIFHDMNVGVENASDKQLTVFFISDIHRRKIDTKLLTKI